VTDRLATVAIHGLAPGGGDAVGRQVGGDHDGRITFVALAAPGETVRARLVRERPRAAWGELFDRLGPPSPVRVDPVCELFGRCGGCQWQHVTRAAQLEAKRVIVERALAVPVGSVVAASEDFGYRDRVRLVVGARGEVGFRAHRSHAVVDVPICPLLGPELAEALPSIRAAACRLSAGTEIDLQAGVEGVHARTRLPGATGQPLHAPGLVRGMDVDAAEPAGAPLRVPAGGFAQAGRRASGILVAAVLDMVGPEAGAVVELYAGSGNFTRHLCRLAAGVAASDADPEAVARGRSNAPGAVWGVRPPQGATDTVVLDPPRQGADLAALALAAGARRSVVYVSCDPQTLARDARRLGEAGLHLERVVSLDMLPQTFHVEVVARFGRVPPAN